MSCAQPGMSATPKLKRMTSWCSLNKDVLTSMIMLMNRNILMNILSDISEVHICSLQKHDFNKGWQYLGIWRKKKKSAILLLGPTLEPAWKRHHIYHPFTKCQDPDLDFSRKILCEVKGIQQWRVSTSGPEKTFSLIHSLWLSQVYYAAFYYIFLQTVNNIPLKLSLQHGT